MLSGTLSKCLLYTGKLRASTTFLRKSVPMFHEILLNVQNLISRNSSNGHIAFKIICLFFFCPFFNSSLNFQNFFKCNLNSKNPFCFMKFCHCYVFQAHINDLILWCYNMTNWSSFPNILFQFTQILSHHADKQALYFPSPTVLSLYCS